MHLSFSICSNSCIYLLDAALLEWVSKYAVKLMLLQTAWYHTKPCSYWETAPSFALWCSTAAENCENSFSASYVFLKCSFDNTCFVIPAEMTLSTSAVSWSIFHWSPNKNSQNFSSEFVLLLKFVFFAFVWIACYLLYYICQTLFRYMSVRLFAPKEYSLQFIDMF